MLSPQAAICSTESLVASWIFAIWSRISSVALEVWVESDLTSLATTAKPLPASPARAASMVAFSASRLVCEAICEISPTTEPTLSTESESEPTMPFALLASSTASSAMLAPREDCARISPIELDSSSAALAILFEFFALLSAIPAATLAWWFEFCASEESRCEDAPNSLTAPAIAVRTSFMTVPKRPIAPCNRSPRSLLSFTASSLWQKIAFALSSRDSRVMTSPNAATFAPE